MKQQQKTWQGSSTKRRNSAFFLFVFLGMLTAFAPFVTDMYLPSLPAMTHYFGVSASMVQLGLTFSMLGLAIGQIIFGPLSDKFGRRLPLFGVYGFVPAGNGGMYFCAEHPPVYRPAPDAGDGGGGRNRYLPLHRHG